MIFAKPLVIIPTYAIINYIEKQRVSGGIGDTILIPFFRRLHR